MKFVDEVVVDVRAGNGGRGCLSFQRGPNLPKGGPDGGNGGDGGDVVLFGDQSINTLVDLRSHALLHAPNGKSGSSNHKTGASGKPLRVRVPIGTTVIDDETLEIIGDVRTGGNFLRVAIGGRRGRGNASFRSSTNRSPRQTTKGAGGEFRRLRLQLKLIADVGLLGMPNAGKSTFLRRISASRPRVADYPFTTLAPKLGVVRVDIDRSFVVADLPGLISGAAHGVGLGTRFLRHLTRTNLLLHLVDISNADSDPIASIKAVERELFLFSNEFRTREIWTVATKVDAVNGDRLGEIEQTLKEAIPERPTYVISSISGRGIDDLVYALADTIEDRNRSLARDIDAKVREEEVQRRIGKDILNTTIKTFDSKAST